MDSIRPLGGTGEDVFAHVSWIQSPRGREEISPLVTPTPTSPAHTRAPQLTSEQATIKQLAYKARQAYQLGRYDEASVHFVQLFRWLRFNRDNRNTEFFQAMFEFGWVLQIQDERKKLRQFFNAALAQQLESLPKEPVKDLSKTWPILKTLQDIGLHDPKTIPETAVPDEALLALVTLFQQEGANQIARDLLYHLEIRHLLGLLAAQNAARLLSTESLPKTPPQKRLASNIPFGYELFGVPVSPLLQGSLESIQRISDKTIKPERRIDRVEAISALPNYTGRPKGRQKRQNTKPSNKGKPRKMLPKPSITL